MIRFCNWDIQGSITPKAKDEASVIKDPFSFAIHWIESFIGNNVPDSSKRIFNVTLPSWYLKWGRAELSYWNFNIIVTEIPVFSPNIVVFGAKIGQIGSPISSILPLKRALLGHIWPYFSNFTILYQWVSLARPRSCHAPDNRRAPCAFCLSFYLVCSNHRPK